MTSPIHFNNEKKVPELIRHKVPALRPNTEIYKPVPYAPYNEFITEDSLKRFHEVSTKRVTVKPTVNSGSSSPIHFQSKSDSLPPISFSPVSLVIHFQENCHTEFRDASNNILGMSADIEDPVWIIGGSASHILFHEIIPSDLDLCFYLKSPHCLALIQGLPYKSNKIVELLIDFAILRLCKDKYDLNKFKAPEIRYKIYKEYFHDLVIDPSFTYICFGGLLDLQFIADKTHRRYVAKCDSFHIALKEKPYAMCLKNAHKQCNHEDFRFALSQLQNYIYDIEKIRNVRNLFFRLPLKVGQGYKVDLKAIDIAIDQLLAEFPLTEGLKTYKRFLKYLDKHFDIDNHQGRAIYFLNFLNLLATKKQENPLPTESINNYMRLIATGWKSKQSELSHFSMLISKHPDRAIDLLNVINGLYYLKARSSTQQHEAYPLSKDGKSILTRIVNHIDKSKLVLELHQDPITLLDNFIKSYRTLYSEFYSEENLQLLNELGKEFSVTSSQVHGVLQLTNINELFKLVNSEGFHHYSKLFNVSLSGILATFSREFFISKAFALSDYCEIHSQLEDLAWNPNFAGNRNLLQFINFLKSINLFDDNYDAITANAIIDHLKNAEFLPTSVTVVIQRILNLLISKINQKNTCEQLDTYLEFIQKISALKIFSPQQKHDFAQFYFNKGAQLFSVNFPEQLFHTYTSLTSYLKRNELQQNFVEILNGILDKIIQQTLVLTQKFINLNQFDKAFSTFSIVLKQGLYKKNPEVAISTFFPLLKHAIDLKKGNYLYFSGIAVRSLQPYIKLEKNNADELYKLAEYIVSTPPENATITDKMRNKISVEILQWLIQNKFGSDILPSLCQKIKKAFLSGKESLNEITNILLILKNHPNLSETSCLEIQRLEKAIKESNEVPSAIIDFLLHFDSVSVETLIFHRKFDQIITIDKKKILIWRLIDKQLNRQIDIDIKLVVQLWNLAHTYRSDKIKDLWYIQVLNSFKLFSNITQNGLQNSNIDLNLLVSFLLENFIKNTLNFKTLTNEEQTQLINALKDAIPVLILNHEATHFDSLKSLLRGIIQNKILEPKLIIPHYFQLLSKNSNDVFDIDKNHFLWPKSVQNYDNESKQTIINEIAIVIASENSERPSKDKFIKASKVLKELIDTDLLKGMWSQPIENAVMHLINRDKTLSLVPILIEKELFKKFSLENRTLISVLVIKNRDLSTFKILWPLLQPFENFSKEDQYKFSQALKASNQLEFIQYIKEIYVNTNKSDIEFYKTYLESLTQISHEDPFLEIVNDFQNSTTLNLKLINNEYDEEWVELQRNYHEQDEKDEDLKKVKQETIDLFHKKKEEQFKSVYLCEVALFKYAEMVFSKYSELDIIRARAEILSLHYEIFEKQAKTISSNDKVQIITSLIIILCKTEEPSSISLSATLFLKHVELNEDLLFLLLEQIAKIPLSKWKMSMHGVIERLEHKLIPSLNPKKKSLEPTYKKIFNVISRFQQGSDKRWLTGLNLFGTLIVNVDPEKNSTKFPFTNLIKEKLYIQEIFKNLLHFSKMCLSTKRIEVLLTLDRTANYILSDAQTKFYFENHVKSLEQLVGHNKLSVHNFRKVQILITYLCSLPQIKNSNAKLIAVENFIKDLYFEISYDHDIEKVLSLIQLGFDFLKNPPIVELLNNAHLPLIPDLNNNTDKRSMLLWLEHYLILQICSNYMPPLLTFLVDSYNNALSRLEKSKYEYDVNIILLLFSNINEIFIVDYFQNGNEHLDLYKITFKKTILTLMKFQKGRGIVTLTYVAIKQLITFPIILKIIFDTAKELAGSKNYENLYKDVQNLINNEHAKAIISYNPSLSFLNKEEQSELIESGLNIISKLRPKDLAVAASEESQMRLFELSQQVFYVAVKTIKNDLAKPEKFLCEVDKLTTNTLNAFCKPELIPPQTAIKFLHYMNSVDEASVSSTPIKDALQTYLGTLSS